MTTKNTKVLIVDDEETIRKLLAQRFSREGWDIETADDGLKGVISATTGGQPTVIISDIKMPGLDGFQFIETLRSKGINCPVVIITGHGDKECAVEACHKGAFDYIEKPFDMDHITFVVKRAVERENLRCRNIELMKALKIANTKLEQNLEIKTVLLDQVDKTAGHDELLIGKSDHIQGLKDTIKTIAESFSSNNSSSRNSSARHSSECHDPVILINGESGVGKEVVARYIHNVTFSTGKDKPFVAVNCAAFPEHLLESELFGYEKGAFTGAQGRKLGLFEVASSGSLFLDEIGEMDLKMQAKLLRVLQERILRRVGGTVDIPVSPHIIAATNRDLGKMVEQRTFREDLYYRLNTIPLTVAPLRSRQEDIPVLADFFLKKLSHGRNKRFTGFSISAIRALTSYAWPGNVRELRSVIERSIILEKGPEVQLSHLRQEHLKAVQAVTGGGFDNSVGTNGSAATVVEFKTSSGATLNNGNPDKVYSEISEKGLTGLRKEMDDNFVKQILLDSLTLEQGNVSCVARKLKLDRANLLRMFRRFNIQPELFRQKKAG